MAASSKRTRCIYLQLLTRKTRNRHSPCPSWDLGYILLFPDSSYQKVGQFPLESFSLFVESPFPQGSKGEDLKSGHDCGR